MARKQARTVQLERQPHRDAVLRLRQVYHKLWQSQQPERLGAAAPESERQTSQVQEVSR